MTKVVNLNEKKQEHPNEIMGPEHEYWVTFINYLEGRIYEEHCDGTQKYARAILTDMAKTFPLDIEKSLASLNRYPHQDGSCDCKIVMNSKEIYENQD